MRLLIDAQLPRRLAYALRERGHDAIHTLDLPRGNSTADAEIVRWADQNDAVVITKDNDFFESRALTGEPKKLCILRLGNCGNEALIDSVLKNLDVVVRVVDQAACVEFGREKLVVHP